jgi:hypothetical protein
MSNPLDNQGSSDVSPYGQQQYSQPAPSGQTGGYGPQAGYGYPQAPTQPATNGIGVAGFVTGLLGLVLCWVPWLGILLAIVGTALSGVGIAQGKKKGQSVGLAIAGLVCGIIALIPAVLIMVALFSVASQLPG